MIKNILFFIGGTIVFLAGVIIYGITINIREVPLREAMSLKGYEKLSNVNIIVDKSSFSLNVYDDTVFIKSYRAVFGRNHSAPKRSPGDKATPVGKYEVIDIDTNSVYNVFIKLNYPNINDITEALRRGIITEKEFSELRFQFYYGNAVNFNPAVSDSIGIHGMGKLNFIFKNLPFAYNWTSGSVAISDEDISELASIIKRGTKVVIK